MQFKDKINQSVAEAVSKIMGGQLQERDEGKPGKMFAKIAAKAAKRYGSQEAGNRVAGAIRAKVLAKEDWTDEELDNLISEAAKSIEEELKGGQVKLDKNHNNKIDGQDFKILRGQKKTNEEVEQVEEGMSHQAKTTMKHIPNASPALKQAAKDIKPGIKGYQDRVAMLKAGGVKEEVENLDEVKMADLPSTKVQGRAYGSSKPQPSALDLVKGPKEKDLKSIESEKKKTIKEEDAYDKHMKPSDKPHDKDAAKKRAQDAAVAARKSMTKEEVELTLDDYLLEDLIEFVMSEEFQQLDELSKSTLGSYVTKASKDMRSHAHLAGSKDSALMAHQMGYRRGEKSPIKGGTKGEKRVSSEIVNHQTKANNRISGIAGAARRLAKEEVELQEKLSASANAGDYIKDFQKSDAPQFQGKSPEKRRIMGIAAYLASKRGK